MKKTRFLGLNILTCKYSDYVDFIVKKAKRNKKLTIAPLAIHSLVLSVFDEEYAKSLKNIDHLLPDSYWHLWGLNLLKKKKAKDRFYGPRFMKDLVRKLKAKGLNTYLFGGNDEVNRHLTNWFDRIGPGKGKLYFYKAGFPIKQGEKKELVRKINSKGSGVLFIGIGTPLQHEVLLEVGNSVKIPSVGVGAAFNLLSGVEKMAPVGWQNVGLEWLYRLWQNPKRLYKRYFLCLLYFPLLFIEVFKKR